jgi:tetratricopeptide (TPR) repeat protein
MDEDRQVERWLLRAEDQRRRGDWDGAIDSLRNVLTQEPEHAIAHASLAFALLGARRLPGAIIEADLALGFGGGEAYCHLAAAAVAHAQRKLDVAWQHCLVALEAQPEDLDAHVIGAHIRLHQREHELARGLLQRALELEPQSPEALVMLARVELDDGQLAEAGRLAGQALESEPGHVDAHVVAGHIDLRRGDLAAAEEHARFALRQDPTGEEAIHLWTSLKARRSWTLGLWWRLNAFVALRSERRMLMIMVGTFMLVRLAIILADAAELSMVSSLLSLGWLAFCAYTWVAPAFFRRMIERDLVQVTLRSDY